MALTIDTFGQQVKQALLAEPGPAGREVARKLLEQAVKDSELVKQHLGNDQPQRKVLYQDHDLGFAILGHVFHEARRTQPHDHGDSWAIYGQVSGETIMDSWEIVEPGRQDQPGKVRLRRSSVLTSGSARTYNEGEIHSPRRDGPATLFRIEGNPNQAPPAKWIAIE